MESDLIPYNACSVLPAQRVLVLAPHPDDEVFACGGAIARHVAAGVAVSVVVLTDGALYGDAVVRQQESIQAATVLGYGEPEFWNLPDRGLRCSEALVRKLIDKIMQIGADLVYAPSPWEIHPDHQQAQLLAVEAVLGCASDVRLAFYEVGAPLRPNVLLNITDVLAVKETAMRCFESQLLQQNYVVHIQALNQYRTYTLPREVLAAEAFCVQSAQELRLTAAHRFPGSPDIDTVDHGYRRTTVAPHSARMAPTVSILIRTIGRRSVLDAIASVAAQSLTDLEILVVNASGQTLTGLGAGLDARVRVLEPGMPLLRSAAANALLDAAHGNYALFLDDDDLLLPDHLQKLVAALDVNPNLIACYSDVRTTQNPRANDRDERTHIYQREFDPVLLQFQNYLPIHAVMFRMAAVSGAPACRFAEDLALFEDWDFWLQLASKGDFRRVPGVSALYVLNASGGSGHAVQDGSLRQAMLQRLGVRQLTRWRPDDVTQMVDWQTHRMADLEQARQETVLARQETDIVRQEAGVVKARISGLTLQLDAMIQSTSWRLTRPLRAARRVVDRLSALSLDKLLRNGFRSVRGEIRRHKLRGFVQRLPHYWRHRLRYGAVLVSTEPQSNANFSSALPVHGSDRRLHPDLTDDEKFIDARISVVIPTLNAGLEFGWLLRKLRSQKGLQPIEIVIVDSGSQDETVALAKEAGCRVLEISQAEFSHSHARNLGAENASGDYLIFMVQDAYPIGDYWAYGMLRYLLDHADGGLVAASCSEYGRSDSDMMYDAMIDTHYRFLGCHADDRIGDYRGADHMALRSRGQLSDVACLISRALFGQYTYRGDYAEDLDLGIRLIKDGHQVAMLASVKVIHSHNRAAFYYLKRSYVDVIFLVGMFDDFLVPAVDSVQGMLTGIVSCAQHVSSLLPALDVDRPEVLLSQSLADWIKVCRKQCHDIRVDGVCALEDHRLDGYINDLKQRLDGGALDGLALAEARRFTDSFLARLEQFHGFILGVYGAQDGLLRAGLKGAVCKTFAATAGSVLGFLYMDRLGSNGPDQHLVNQIDNELRKGV